MGTMMTHPKFCPAGNCARLMGSDATGDPVSSSSKTAAPVDEVGRAPTGQSHNTRTRTNHPLTHSNAWVAGSCEWRSRRTRSSSRRAWSAKARAASSSSTSVQSSHLSAPYVSGAPDTAKRRSRPLVFPILFSRPLSLPSSLAPFVPFSLCPLSPFLLSSLAPFLASFSLPAARPAAAASAATGDNVIPADFTKATSSTKVRTPRGSAIEGTTTA